MKTALSDVLTVARYELADAVQSRRVLIVLVLYLAGAMLACNGFITALHRMEEQLVELLALPASSAPGSALNALWQSEQFREMISHLVGDKEVAKELLAVHPIALVYGWLAFVFTPILVMLLVSPRISDETGTGSARFVLLRTTRQRWCLGKYVGQGLMIVFALTLSAIGSWSVARLRLAGIDGLAVAQGMIIYSWKAWIIALAFVGLALGISQLTVSPVKAMGFGFTAWIVVGVLGLAAHHYEGEGWKQAWHLVYVLVPLGHRMDMWRTNPACVARAALFLVCLGLTYMYAGYAFFRKKDI